ncbi:RimK family alpha-L-glutamate ligase [Candidatus Woesearchaeota archaeon CG10_big_fil_rev_8_21_14_0_10_36_11]|nr:MAG: RimK family alpha-L-glutamate ligase [Candidatus Woesearchaeota archaeon CG10_big_fil_rev_8_21_14_0_10_36_11]
MKIKERFKKNLLVVDNVKKMSLNLPNAETVSAKDYLLDSNIGSQQKVKVFNLCNSYRYQSEGYYVSLLAEARGHKHIPTISTIQDLKSLTAIKHIGNELDELIQKELITIKSDKFELSIYFGKNIAKKYSKLSLAIFKFVNAPLMKAFFNHYQGKWQLQNINPLSLGEIPENHRDFFRKAAKEYFSKDRRIVPHRTTSRYDMAILYNPKEKDSPSNSRAMKKFIKAANALSIDAELITRDDLSRLAEFDMLFIRETTNVNHHTYRFSRKATAEGLITIDDPLSILKCCNKVYLAELLRNNNIKAPKTLIVHSKNNNPKEIINKLSLPIVLKKPDSSFSQGVVKANNEEELITETKKMLLKSDLVIAQEFLPTQFDWRIGIIDRIPIFACKYYMVKKHWQIIKKESDESKEGDSETFPIDLVPKSVIKTALKAANLIGDGLYGVDLKQINDEVFVIEVNDNPNIDAGVEDLILKEALYLKIMSVFLNRIEMRKFRGMV